MGKAPAVERWPSTTTSTSALSRPMGRDALDDFGATRFAAPSGGSTFEMTAYMTWLELLDWWRVQIVPQAQKTGEYVEVGEIEGAKCVHRSNVEVGVVVERRFYPRKMNIGKEIGGGGSDYWDVSSDTDELATDPVQVRFHHSFLGASWVQVVFLLTPSRPLSWIDDRGLDLHLAVNLPGASHEPTMLVRNSVGEPRVGPINEVGQWESRERT